ncbi:MAG: hypothetical protein RLZZ337_43 [Bacteroidota bacterium]|jgi:hypothetical protein
MKKILFTLLMFLTYAGFAQNAMFTKVFNNDSSDAAHSAFQASNGDYYLLSSTNSSGQGGSDVQITKTSGLGDVIWSYTYGTSANDIGHKIKPTSDGGAVVAGYSSGFISNGDEAFVMKINSSGTLQWVNGFGLDSNSQALDVVQAANGAIYATGFMEMDSFGFNTFVARLDASGNVSWVKSYGGQGKDIGRAIAEDRQSRIVIVGSTENDSVTIGGTGDVDISFLVINAGGTVITSRNYGTSSLDYATAVTTTTTYRYIIGGNTEAGGTSSQDAFVMQLDTNFNVNYGYWFGTPNEDRTFSINRSSNGTISLGVSSESILTGRDMLVVQTTAIGGVSNALMLGGNDADGDDGVAVVGSDALGFSVFSSGQSLGNTNTKDLYLVKLSSDNILSNCININEPVQSGNLSLSSAIFTNAFDTGYYATRSFSQASISNSDSTLCCDLTANVAGDSFTICTDEVIAIGRPAISGYTYSWSAAGSTWTSNAANPQVSPTSNTLYKLVVSSSNSACASDSAYVYVKVNTKMQISGVADTYFCENDSVTLQGPSGMNFYAWTVGTSTSNGATFKVKSASTVTLFMLDNNSCTYRDTVVVSKINLPTFSLGNDTTICENLSLTLAGPIGMANYKWNGTNSTSRFYTTNASQTHTLEVTDTYGCKASDQILVLTNPASTFSLGADTSFCEGTDYIIYGPSALKNWKWNDTTSSSFSLTVNKAGTYWLEAYNSFNCPSFDTITVSTIAEPKFSLGRDTGFCDVIDFNLVGPNGVDYLWFNGSDQQTYKATGPGNYYLDVTDANGCSSSDSIRIELYNSPNIFLGNDTTIALGNTLSLSAGAGYVKYQWSNNQTSQTINVTQSGTYSVTVTDANGCTGSDTIVVNVSASVQYVNGAKYTLYPNPAYALLNVETDGNMVGSVLRLLDAKGAVVYEKVLAGNSTSINVSTMASGFYYATISGNNKTLTFKVVIDQK